MIRAALLALLASPAIAGDRLSFAPDTDPSNGIFGRIVVVNERDFRGVFHMTARFDTSRGPVIIDYRSTRNGADPEKSADNFDVLLRPDGIVAVPPVGRVLEGETIEILLMEYMGG